MRLALSRTTSVSSPSAKSKLPPPVSSVPETSTEVEEPAVRVAVAAELVAVGDDRVDALGVPLRDHAGAEERRRHPFLAEQGEQRRGRLLDAAERVRHVRRAVRLVVDGEADVRDLPHGRGCRVG